MVRFRPDPIHNITHHRETYCVLTANLFDNDIKKLYHEFYIRLKKKLARYVHANQFGNQLTPIPTLIGVCPICV